MPDVSLKLSLIQFVYFYLQILEDFNQLFPNHSAQFFENWDVVAEKICNLAIAKGNTEASWRTSVTTGTNINFDDAKGNIFVTTCLWPLLTCLQEVSKWTPNKYFRSYLPERIDMF